ncbi:MAG: hypothetical protein GY851_04930 [bacterium]|nr:hypothetical protein [bacterium]
MLFLRSRRFFFLCLLLLLGSVGVAIYLSTSPGDVSLLKPFHERYNYARLEEDLLAEPGERDRFTFAVLGDSRNNVSMAARVYTVAASEDPRVIFNTGDLIRGGTVSEFLDNHIPLLEITDPVPVFCVPGNHERGPRRDFSAYEALYGGTRFAFDYGACRFVGFNASENIRISEGELAFLDEELSKPGAKYKFVFFHIPPKYFEATICPDDRRGFSWNADELREILTRHRVTEVFMGHIHGYASTVVDGVRYTLTAGAGAPLSARLPVEARLYHCLVLHVTPEGLTQELVYLSHETGEWTRRTIY